MTHWESEADKRNKLRFSWRNKKNSYFIKYRSSKQRKLREGTRQIEEAFVANYGVNTVIQNGFSNTGVFSIDIGNNPLYAIWYV